MQEKSGRKLIHDLQGLAVLSVALILGGLLLVRNNVSGVSGISGGDVTPPAPTQAANLVESSPTPSGWRGVIESQLTSSPVPPRPTLVMPRPTLETPEPTAVFTEPPTSITYPTGPVLWSASPTPTGASAALGPTRPAPTPVPVSSPDIRSRNNPRTGEFSPPPEQVPLSVDGRDHFYFRRPVNSSSNSTSLFFYAYGSDGPTNDLRVHHGIDMPNPIGKEVLAAAPGRVVWAGDNYTWYENGQRIERAYTYGNVIIVEHDFGFNGQRLFTLYAHLQSILVTVDQRVETGQVIGLSGNTGMVSGPHVHFEVRLGQNWYYATRNPLLWMAPYQGHGIVAGRISYPNGQSIQDAEVRLKQNGKVIDSTTTYVNPKWTKKQDTWDVVPDDTWRENFVFGDVPVGEYEVVVITPGKSYSQTVSVRPATTSFVDFGQGNVEVTPVG